MKKLFAAFPLLKKKRFYVFLSLILLICVASGFLYLPEHHGKGTSFEEEKAAIEEALSVAEENLLNCKEEDRPRFLQEKAFFESALKFRLSPWSSDFAYEALSLYAALSVGGEDGAPLQKLEAIVKERDKEGFLKLCKEDPRLPDPNERLILAEDSPSSPGKNALLYDISRLEESLASGKDRYFAVERDLTQRDRVFFQSLLRLKEEVLLNGKYNPVPANRETLLFTQRLAACLISILLVAVAGYGESAEKKFFYLFAIPLVASVLLCTVTLFVTTHIFAPGTVQPEPLTWGGSLPFFPALVGRFSCRVLGTLPLMLLALQLRGLKWKLRPWKILVCLPVLHLLFHSAARLGKTLFSALFFIGDLAECVFPDSAAHAFLPATPWMGVVSWLLALGFSLFLLLKKEQKITEEKQELSLEMQNEL